MNGHKRGRVGRALVVALVAMTSVYWPTSEVVRAGSGAAGAVSMRFDGMADRITAGGEHTCVISDIADVLCWGRGQFGQLGNQSSATIGDSEKPVSGSIVNLAGSAAVSAGSDHTCALVVTGTVSCWGLGTSGRLGYGNTSNVGVSSPVLSAGDVSLPSGVGAISVVSGSDHTCAILETGAVSCWGEAGTGALGYGNTNDIGDDETPATNPVNGGIVALPGGRDAVAVSAGGARTCALLDDGDVTCWGAGANGALGYGNTNSIGDTETPAANPVNGGIVALPGGRAAVALTVGSAHTCALLDNGTATCWGSASSGQLGYGNTNSIGDTETPAANPVDGGIIRTADDGQAVSVSVGGFHACALLDNGSVTCWGDNTYGQLGFGNTTTIGDNELPAANPVGGGLVPLPGNRSATAVTAGEYHTCALLDDGTVSCWGRGANGRLGYGSTSNVGNSSTPLGTVPLPFGRRALAVSAGNAHTCALLVDGQVTCWGSGANGRLGSGTVDDVGDDEFPGDGSGGQFVELPIGRTAIGLSAGGEHTCVVLDNSSVMCWGAASFGRLGYGNLNDIGDNEVPRLNPVNGGIVPLPTGRSALSVSAGGFHTCAVLDNGQATCWGAGIVGRLGYGNGTSNIGDDETLATASPNTVSLPGNRTVASIAAGVSHTCAVATDGAPLCWGNGANGRLGYGNTNSIGDNETPAANPVNGGVVPLANDVAVVRIDGGEAFSCAVTIGNRVQCWGSSSSGQLGFGNTNSIGDNETPAANPVNFGQLRLPQHRTVSHFRSIDPARFLDTRPTGDTVDDLFKQFGQRPAGSTIEVPVAGRDNVSVAAGGVVLSVAAVQPAAGGFLTVWPCTEPRPNASSLNYAAGVNTANTVITSLSVKGSVCIFTSAATQLIVDVVGEVPRSSALTTLPPARFADTRPTGSTIDGNFQQAGQRAANSTFEVEVTGRGSVPALARTVILNVAAVQPAAGGFLTVFPCGSPRPNASNLNFTANVNAANLVIAPAGALGKVCIFTSAATQLLVDVVGYFDNEEWPAPSPLRTVNPARMVDTRPAGVTIDGQFRNLGPVAANATNVYRIINRHPLSEGQVAVLNVTVVNPPATGFVTVWSCEDTAPNASSLNYTAGVTRAVQVVTEVSVEGDVCVLSSQSAHIIVDVTATML
ncbi:MAG TPA: hypothetical protein DCR14_20040 [Acidimicrobiaceae bacterium]|nr:hypothetical protein [Acidimicrobiaceae bacterium]